MLCRPLCPGCCAAVCVKCEITSQCTKIVKSLKKNRIRPQDWASRPLSDYIHLSFHPIYDHPVLIRHGSDGCGRARVDHTPSHRDVQHFFGCCNSCLSGLPARVLGVAAPLEIIRLFQLLLQPFPSRSSTHSTDGVRHRSVHHSLFAMQRHDLCPGVFFNAVQ